MRQGDFWQERCAHCYRRLPLQHWRQAEILCSECATAWFKLAETILRLRLPQALDLVSPLKLVCQTARRI